MSVEKIYCEAEELVKLLEETDDVNLQYEITKLIFDNYKIKSDDMLHTDSFITMITNITEKGFCCNFISFGDDVYINSQLYNFNYENFDICYNDVLDMHFLNDYYDNYFIDNKLSEIIKDKKWNNQ
jgi:hypothetical protein